jgi:hypothetical protein
MRRFAAPGAVIAVVAIAWALWPESDDRAIKRRLNALAADANAPAAEGLGIVTKAARIGTYFTDDVLVEAGEGAAPIAGRETLVGMAARIQPPESEPAVTLEDVAVSRRAGTNLADVRLTATLTRRDPRTGERAMDAREFMLEVRKDEGEWRISRVVAVETLRRQR